MRELGVERCKGKRNSNNQMRYDNEDGVCPQSVQDERMTTCASMMGEEKKEERGWYGQRVLAFGLGDGACGRLPGIGELNWDG